MKLGKVVGAVVATTDVAGIDRPSYLLVEPCDTAGRSKGRALIAMDLVGAGPDNIVIVAEGSSTRQTPLTDKKAVDAVIVGLVDRIDVANRRGGHP